MEKIIIEATGIHSEIFVGEKLESSVRYLPEKGVVIVTDENVRRLYGSRFPSENVLAVIPGESSKSLSAVEKLAGDLLSMGMDRSCFILGIGGGVVCDLAGFLAAIFMRGVRCGYVSTTLLAQVDASTGGKTGVNLGHVKNIIGVIRQPEFVICDTQMLLTLPDDEYLSGLAEMIKTAIIGDADLFVLIEKNHEKILARDQDLLSMLISRAVKLKAYVVSQDEREKGLRRILNFGHTYGHAVELQKSVKHGFAVAAGMEFAAEFSFSRGLISLEEKSRITALLRKFDLLQDYDLSPEQVYDLIMHDKKKSGNEIYFVFTGGVGKADVERVSMKEIIDFYKFFNQQ